MSEWPDLRASRPSPNLVGPSRHIEQDRVAFSSTMEVTSLWKTGFSVAAKVCGPMLRQLLRVLKRNAFFR